MLANLKMALEGQLDRSSKPTLVVVSGPSGSGKTTLAHRLAAARGIAAAG